MALFGANFTNDTQRAIEHARLMLATGSGLESVIHEISRADLGGVSNRFRRLIKVMQTGTPAEAALDRERARALARPYTLFVEALASEGPNADHRLDECSKLIAEETRGETHKSGERMQMWIKTIALMLCTTIIFVFVVWFVNFMIANPNPFFPSVSKLDPAIEHGFFGFLGLAVSVVLVLMSAET